jgi:hypothetical protein
VDVKITDNDGSGDLQYYYNNNNNNNNNNYDENNNNRNNCNTVKRTLSHTSKEQANLEQRIAVFSKTIIAEN